MSDMGRKLRTIQWARRLSGSALVRYGVAAALGLAAVWVEGWLEPLSGHVSYQVLLGAVALSALYGGVGNGLLTLLIAGMARYQFYLPNHLHAATEAPAAGLPLLLYLLLGVMVAWLAGELRTTQRKLAAALTSIEEAVAIADAKGRVVFLNPAAEQLSGWERNEARGRPIEEVIRVAGEASGSQAESPVAKPVGERVPLDIGSLSILRSRDGAERPIEGDVSPIRDGSGRLIGSIAVFRDIALRRALEDQLRRAQRIEALGRLAGSVAHDFNNFLTVIAGHAELLGSRIPADAAPSVREDVNEILKTSARAGQLSRRLMLFSRRQTVQPRLVDLNEVLSSLTRMLQSLLGVRIQLETRLEAKGQVKADPAQLEQVILNLAINARDAMPNGGSLSIRTRDLAVDRSSPGELADLRPGPYVELEVSDTGCGMDESVRSRIFEPFFTTKPEGAGTGLGLSIVYGFVKQCGGGIEVSSQPSHGARFSIRLPRCDEVLPAPAKQNRVSSGHAGAATILVAEPDDGVRRLMRSALEREGFTVLEADDGLKAAHIATDELDRIDLIVADAEMPLVGHAELVERMTLIRPGLRLLCVGDTNKAPSPTARGTMRFLSKPFTAAAFLAEVEGLLGPRRRAA